VNGLRSDPPNYYDAQFKIQQDLRQNESVDVIGIVSRDSLTRHVFRTPDPAQVKTQDKLGPAFNRFGVTYKRQFEDGHQLDVLPPWGGTDSLAHLVVVRAAHPRCSISNQPNSVWRAQMAWSPGRDGSPSSSAWTPRAAHALALAARRRQPCPPREGDIAVFGQQPRRSKSTPTTGPRPSARSRPYAQIDAKLFDGKPARSFPVFRVEPFVISGSRQSASRGRHTAHRLRARENDSAAAPERDLSNACRGSASRAPSASTRRPASW